MMWVVHVARIIDKRNTRLQSENMKERGHVGDTGVEVKTILK
jgi:hypothetical protein